MGESYRAGATDLPVGTPIGIAVERERAVERLGIGIRIGRGNVLPGSSPRTVGVGVADHGTVSRSTQDQYLVGCADDGVANSYGLTLNQPAPPAQPDLARPPGGDLAH
jgi:hypothetical protein